MKVHFVPSYKPQAVQGDPSNQFISHDTFRSIQINYLQLASVYLDGTVSPALEWDQELSFLKQHLFSEYREATSRVFIDALITPILRENNLQVRLEEKLYVKDLPNCIADYVVYNGNGEALGVIETKTGGKVKAESVIQCMLQLLALRTKAPHTIFGVVTDAVRYIFVVLTDEGRFEFEKKGYRDVKTWQNLYKISCIFNTFLQMRQRFVFCSFNFDQFIS